jgi:uncharacterized protein (TIGR03437 family)
MSAASYAKGSNGAGSAVAPGSLIQIYSSLPGPDRLLRDLCHGQHSWVELVLALAGFRRPINQFPSSSLINAQVPFEIASSSTSMVLIVNEVPSAPVSVPVIPQAPGIFTAPPDGQHNEIFVYVDPAEQDSEDRRAAIAKRHVCDSYGARSAWHSWILLCNRPWAAHAVRLRRIRFRLTVRPGFLRPNQVTLAADELNIHMSAIGCT